MTSRSPTMTRQPPRSPDEVESLLARYDLGRNVSLAARFPPDQYPHTRRCAILVPLYFSTRDRQLHVLLTLRARNLRTHASNVSFPGGARDPDDVDDTATALREAQEEVGLSPGDVRVVARLPPTFVSKNNAVFPIVGFIPENFVPKLNPHEVTMTFSVPLKDFVEKPLTYTFFHFALGVVIQTPSLTQVHPDGQRLRVWGATCTFCVLVARAVFGVTEPLVIFVVDRSRAQGKTQEEIQVDGDDLRVMETFSSSPTFHNQMGAEDAGVGDRTTADVEEDPKSQGKRGLDVADANVGGDGGVNLFEQMEVYYHMFCRAARSGPKSRL